jgi:tRNA threonylcarbamoyladenosine biosynthesis protein TsaB
VAQLQALDEDCLVVGDGAQRYRDIFQSLGGVEVAKEGFRHPTAGSLVELAHARALREEFVTANEIEPLYMRAPDARINWQSRERT